MSETNTPEDIQDAQPTSENGEQAAGGLDAAAVEALKKQLEEAQAKSAEYLDGWQRSQAEFLNYKKRQERDYAAQTDLMRAANIKRFLPVLDDLERAMANRPADNAWANGIELVVRKFMNILEAEGVKRIEAQGQPFDPNLHEAIAQEPSESVPSGHVIDVVQQGYMMGERVIRHALVRVAA